VARKKTEKKAAAIERAPYKIAEGQISNQKKAQVAVNAARRKLSTQISPRKEHFSSHGRGRATGGAKCRERDHAGSKIFPEAGRVSANETPGSNKERGRGKRG